MYSHKYYMISIRVPIPDCICSSNVQNWKKCTKLARFYFLIALLNSCRILLSSPLLKTAFNFLAVYIIVVTCKTYK